MVEWLSDTQRSFDVLAAGLTVEGRHLIGSDGPKSGAVVFARRPAAPPRPGDRRPVQGPSPVAASTAASSLSSLKM